MTPTVFNLLDISNDPDSIQWSAHQQLGRNGASIYTVFECGESAQRIALIRCEPGASAQSHRHLGHETFLILDGDFEDENGLYLKGDLVIYPPGSSHAWKSSNGALIYATWGGAVTSTKVDPVLATNSAAYDSSAYDGRHLI
ncbi:Anti-ECFsigma factor, ChrR [Pseudomonas amygdali pv. mellea]|uniref:cupin domain-containing protein n=1 Tax=Pseudomonas amygdali TaxID=47877 RepID=UPI0006E4B65C|nr:cupin domain-containing protein [Pseudomonas amygdali]KPW41404.1 Anti-ECFsigma factor, ChrR [Pseudomonas amygdali]KPX79356.1 Anti-ECFsigma factor, ChrR [Pseudomonas amygdali pv. mellea]